MRNGVHSTIDRQGGRARSPLQAPPSTMADPTAGTPPLPLAPSGSKAWTGSVEHSRLSYQLAEAQGATFRSLALSLLRVIWPRALGPPTAIDGDHLVGSGEPRLRLVVLGLGFAQDELGDAEARAACKAIESFRSTAFEAHSYLVLHNRDGRSAEFRDAVQAKLEDLVRTGRFQHAELWDRQRLLQEAFRGMLRLTLTAVRARNLSLASLETLYEHPSFALETVPLETSSLITDQYRLKSGATSRPRLADPAAVILERGDTNLSILIGEFGSGKTTAVARALGRETSQPVYVPGATISSRITSTKSFLEHCIDHRELFSEFPDEDRPALEQLARPVVEYVFKDPVQPLVLILDGLDESAFLSHRGGFQHLFNLLHEVRVPVILTMRSEFWHRGERDFTEVFGQVTSDGEKRRRRLRLIDLRPWTVDQILALIHRYRERVSDRQSRSRLDALAMLVETQRFHTLYGDLPQRPLFLRLIVESVVASGLPSGRIGRACLLRDWATVKILRDVNEPIRAGGEGRAAIASGAESSETTVELAWEAMVAAAGAMVQEYAGELELTAECELESALASRPRLAAVTEPLGLFLNSLLLPAPYPRGTPPRVRFAHRTFQEFFLAWHLLLRPQSHAGLRPPASVAAWVEDIEQEGLLRPEAASVTPAVRRATPPPAKPAQEVSLAPADLEIWVTVESAAGETRLSYLLRSATGKAGFHERRIRSAPLRLRPEDFHNALFDKLEKLHAGAGLDGTMVWKEEIEDELIALGSSLYRSLFPAELRAAYRLFRDRVETIFLVSDEPWIPWEIVRPYDDQDRENPIDDDFLCARFQLSRWLAAAELPGDAVTVERLACFEAGASEDGVELPHAEQELRWLRDLARRHPGIEDRSLPGATSRAVKSRLRAGGLDLLHFVGHGRFDGADPDASGFHLVDGRPLRPFDLHTKIQTRVKVRRPLVFLNACQVGRQGLSLTGLSGWAARWIEDCGCGAFVAPLWTVDDRPAHAFATSFYAALEAGRTFGEAAQAARRQVRELDPPGLTWLAFSVYAHPNARLVLDRPGSSAPRAPTATGDSEENGP